MVTLFILISSAQISSSQRLASLYRFLINVLTDFPDFGKKKNGGRENLCLSTLQILLIHEIFIAFLQRRVYKPVNTSTSPIHNRSFQVPMLVAASGSCFIPRAADPQGNKSSVGCFSVRSSWSFFALQEPEAIGGILKTDLGCLGNTFLLQIYISATPLVNSVDPCYL